MNFDCFFKFATGHDQGPFDYQRRLAGSDSGTICRSQLINIPTGLGKTAAVVLAWLWNRVHLQNPQWPHRLVYCLPMRTLVEQTEREVRRWILRLARKHTKSRDGSGLRWLALHSPTILMGGEDTDKEWDIHPERPAVLIGTQDMMLSRALNRGYGMSRYRWPMHFGLAYCSCVDCDVVFEGAGNPRGYGSSTHRYIEPATELSSPACYHSTHAALHARKRGETQTGQG